MTHGPYNFSRAASQAHPRSARHGKVALQLCHQLLHLQNLLILLYDLPAFLCRSQYPFRPHQVRKLEDQMNRLAAGRICGLVSKPGGLPLDSLRKAQKTEPPASARAASSCTTRASLGKEPSPGKKVRQPHVVTSSDLRAICRFRALSLLESETSSTRPFLGNCTTGHKPMQVAHLTANGCCIGHVRQGQFRSQHPS